MNTKRRKQKTTFCVVSFFPEITSNRATSNRAIFKFHNGYFCDAEMEAYVLWMLSNNHFFLDEIRFNVSHEECEKIRAEYSKKDIWIEYSVCSREFYNICVENGDIPSIDDLKRADYETTA